MIKVDIFLPNSSSRFIARCWLSMRLISIVNCPEFGLGKTLKSMGWFSVRLTETGKILIVSTKILEHPNELETVSETE